MPQKSTKGKYSRFATFSKLSGELYTDR